MDFFEAQDQAKAKTARLVVLFVAAVIATGISIYAVASLGLLYAFPESEQPIWSLPRAGWTIGITAAIMISCSLFKIASLSSGGGSVAKMLGGRRVSASPSSVTHQRLRNVVEEMALASGTRVPEIYVLEREPSINAFAAGYTLDNAAIAVSRGALEQLDREELQGVVAHEFSHILNGDMRLNTRLIGVIFGILVVAVIGRTILDLVGRATFHGGTSRRSSRGDGKGGGAIIAILLVAFAIMVIGYIGVFFGRFIQSAISRQREYLADAAAVQFTRNPSGISNALRKIKAYAIGSRIQNPDSEELSHMFFANALKSSLGGVLATHPPLKERIAAIDPQDLYAKAIRAPKPAPKPAPKTAPTKVNRERTDFVSSISQPAVVGLFAVLQSLPQTAAAKARDPHQAFAVLEACIDPANTTLLNRAPNPVERFALIEIALAAVKDLPLNEIDNGLDRLRRQAEADREVTFEEQCLLIATQRNLKDFKRNANPRLHLFPEAKKSVETILSAIALIDAPDQTEATKAFEAAHSAFNRFGTMLTPNFSGAQNLDTVNAALQTASNSLFAVRKALIEAAAAIASSDDLLSETEQTRIRSLAIALACPLPK